jgi:iron complex outermembrane receptor protein
MVTAQKQEDNLQKIPRAISSLSTDALEARGISSVEELQYAVPGLTLGENTVGTARVTIRSVGNQNYAPGGDRTIGMQIGMRTTARRARNQSSTTRR